MPLRDLFQAPTIAQLAQTLEGSTRASRPPLVPGERDGLLSFAQTRLWFLDHLEGAGVAYHIPLAFVLEGRLDIAALHQAFAALIARHEVLRTVYHYEDGNAAPRAVVLTRNLPELEVLDRTHEDIESLAAHEAVIPFRLESEAPIRVRLVRLGTESSLLLITLHHIAADGWSVTLLMQELGELYARALAKAPLTLPAPALTYQDFARWQRDWLKGRTLEEQADYWRARLDGAPALLALPTDRPRPPAQSYKGRSFSFALDGDLLARLKALAMRTNTTLYMVLLTGFAILLSRLSRETDLVIGTPAAGRGMRETEALVGLFVNSLALRIDLSGEPDTQTLLDQVRSITLDALAHQDLPFDLVVEALRPEYDTSHHPLFQAFFCLIDDPAEAAVLSGVKITSLFAETGVAKFDLMLSTMETPEGLHGAFQYATSLFDEGTISCFARYYERVLAGMVGDPSRSVLRLALFDEDGRRALIAKGVGAQVVTGSATALSLIEAQVARDSDAVAVVYAGEELSYGALNSRANRLARRLKGLKVGPESLVGVYLERGHDLVVALLAVWKAGAGYVPLDPGQPRERLGYMLSDSKVSVVLTQSGLLEGLPAGTARVIALDRERLERFADDDLGIRVDPANLAYVIYTSGSTGRPKGAMLS
ncbi:MAG: AMP-binding protein, partial [Alphaproteobacteria bacterium]|nr:AMP-binding protein [Alphaproteobacteria bacterium]